MYPLEKKFSPEQVLNRVLIWVDPTNEDPSTTISMHEVIVAAMKALNKKPIWEVPKEALPTIEKLKTPATLAEIIRFMDVSDFLEETVSVRSVYKETWADYAVTFEPYDPLVEKNWKRYIVHNNEDVYEVIEQRWNIYIAYNPLTKKYIVYKYLWEWKKNEFLVYWITNIEETEFDWYYFIKYNNWEVGYYYIWENWETTNLWEWDNVSKLNKFWNALCFESSYERRSSVIVHNWDKVEPIPFLALDYVTSINWRNFIITRVNELWSVRYSMFDVDKMEYVFKDVIDINYEVQNIEWVWEKLAKMEYVTFEDRTWLWAKLRQKWFWPKKVKKTV